MSTEKPKLTPESKRTLLEQSLQWIRLLKLHEDSDKNVPVFFSFVKLILINQSFLNTSRYASYDIYELHLDYYRSWHYIGSDYLSFKSKHAGFFKGIKLSFERDHKLAKLLQPSKIGLEFPNKIKKKSLDELIEILKATTGKISMKVMYKMDPFLGVLNEFSSRICRFLCIEKIFTNSIIPSSFGSLGEVKVNGIYNADQFLQILKCNAKSLALTFYGILLDDLHSFLMLKNNAHSLNKTVKQLYLYIRNFDYAMTQRIIEQILLFFPSLVDLRIHAIPRSYEHPENQISNLASDLCQYMRALKDLLFANGLKKIELKFNHQFKCEENCNSEWINKTSNKPEFSGWKCKLEHRYSSRYHDVVLKLSTEEGNSCKFGIELKGEYEEKASNGN